MLAICGVDQEVQTATDGETKLAFREQVFSKGVSLGEGNDGASQTAPSSANADGAEFVTVVWVFVKGKKTAE
jgi:hypothetical protein